MAEIVLSSQDFDFLQFLIFGDDEGNIPNNPLEAVETFYEISKHQARGKLVRLQRNPTFVESYNKALAEWSSILTIDRRASRKGQVEMLLRRLDAIQEIVQERRDDALTRQGDTEKKYSAGESTGFVVVKENRNGVEAKFDRAMMEEEQEIMKRLLILTGNEPTQRLEITGANGAPISVQHTASLERAYGEEALLPSDTMDMVESEGVFAIPDEEPD